MSTVTIYKHNDEMFHETIHQEFYVSEGYDGELFWYGSEGGNKPGVFKLWLLITDEFVKMPFIWPDWQLIVDDVWMEKKLYGDVEELIELRGKVVELRYKEYRFVFQID